MLILLFRRMRVFMWKKGEELGYFEFGSTVVLLFEKDNVILEENLENKEIKMGEKIATIYNRLLIKENGTKKDIFHQMIL